MKELHTKLLMSQLVQTHRKSSREIQIALPVQVYSQLTSAYSIRSEGVNIPQLF